MKVILEPNRCTFSFKYINTYHYNLGIFLKVTLETSIIQCNNYLTLFTLFQSVGYVITRFIVNAHYIKMYLVL